MDVTMFRLFSLALLAATLTVSTVTLSCHTGPHAGLEIVGMCQSLDSHDSSDPEGAALHHVHAVHVPNRPIHRYLQSVQRPLSPPVFLAVTDPDSESSPLSIFLPRIAQGREPPGRVLPSFAVLLL
jgi:hypothetical protein